jgi:hypothetical protein
MATDIIQRAPTVLRSLPSLDRRCKIVSWNVAGLRGALKNSPSVFEDLVQVAGFKHALNSLSLQ